MSAQQTGKSPWFWIAVGCGGFVLVAGIVVVGLAFWGYRAAKNLESELKDPASRQAKVLEILGAERLPEGYFPVMGFSAPFGLMSTAILSDREVSFEEAQASSGRGAEAFEKRGFFYVMMIRTKGEEQQLEDFFSGKTEDTAALRQAGINVSPGEIIRRGELAVPGGTVRFLAQRGSVGLGSVSSRDAALSNILLIDCDQDAKFRFGIWFGPDPAPETPGAAVEVQGSTADEAALREFLGHFRFCGA